MAHQAADKTAELVLIGLDRLRGSGDLALDDGVLLAEVLVEVLSARIDPHLGLATDPVDLASRPLVDLVDIGFRQLRELGGLGRGAESNRLDKGTQAIRDIGDDPLAFAVGRRLHRAGDLLEERRNQSGVRGTCLVRQVRRLDAATRRIAVCPSRNGRVSRVGNRFVLHLTNPRVGTRA